MTDEGFLEIKLHLQDYNCLVTKMGEYLSFLCGRHGSRYYSHPPANDTPPSFDTLLIS